MRSQFLDLGVVVGAQDNRIGHAAEHTRGVGDALAAAQLHGARLHHQRTSAELAHGHIERHPGAGRTLLEDHRQRAAGERRVGIGPAFGPPLPCALAVERVGQHRGNCIAASIRQVEKVAGHAIAAAGWKLAAPAESFSMNSSMCSSPITRGGTIRNVLSPPETVSSA